MPAKGYWILHVSVKNPESYAEYVTLDTPIVTAHGGRFLVRGGQAETPEAPHPLDRHVVVEFPTLQAAKECYYSEAYQNAAAIRIAHAESQVVIVEGVD